MSYKVEVAVAGAGFKLLSDPMDASEPTVRSAKQVESSNAIGSCTFELVPGCWCFDTIGVNDQVRVYDTESKGYVFYGRVLYTTPQGSRDNKCEVVCEDAMGFLKDTVQYIDSKKLWFEGKNPKYPIESIDKDDDSRTMQASVLVRLVVGQHNNTIADNNGDSWKKFKIGTIDLDSEDTVTISAEYEATSFDMLCDIAEELCCDFRVRYDGMQPILDFGYNIGGDGGSFTLGDNLVQCGLKTSMVDVKTRMFPFGETYAKLEKIERKATVKNGAYKASTKSGETDWSSSAKYSDGKAAKTCRYRVDGALKAVIKVGRRDKSYPMVVFTDKLISDKSHEVLRKYTTKRSTSDNVVKYYPVPEDAKYCYVLGADSSCTTYGHYKNANGDEIGKNYRVDLAFWKKYVSESWLSKKLETNGLKLGKTVDGSNDTLYYLGRNEDVFGAIEGTCVKDDLLDTKKITTRSKKSHSLTDLAGYVGEKRMTSRAKRFINYAVKEAVKASECAFELTATAYDLAAAGLDYTKLRLLDRWTVDNELVGINHTSKVVRIERDLLSPWSVSVEFGTKVQRASGTAGGGTEGGLDKGLLQGSGGDEGDDEADTYDTLASQIAEAAEKAAEIAVEKADELDQLSYLIQVDSLAAGQMASDAYDTVLPITDAMRGLLADAQDQADSLTSVKESQSKTISLANDLARAQASYAYETEKSVVRWKQTYTADLDAWASEDPEVQAEIAAAYKLLYGANGTAEKPEADSAQGHLNAAKAANVEAASTEAEMRVELASANAYLASCEYAADKAAAAAKKAQKAYDALKKKTKASRKELDAAKAARDAALKKEEQSQAKVDAANVRCAEAEANYTAAQEALATAEAQVATAQAEVDTAMNGIHQHYQTCIEQTAKSVKLSASKVEGLETKTAELEVTAEQISASVEDKASKSYVQQKANEVTSTIEAKGYQTASQVSSTVSQTLNSWTFTVNDISGLSSYMSFEGTNGTGTITLGGRSSTLNLGGSNTTLNLGSVGRVYDIVQGNLKVTNIECIGGACISLSNSNTATFLNSGNGYADILCRNINATKGVYTDVDVYANQDGYQSRLTKGSSSAHTGWHGLYSGHSSKWLSWCTKDGTAYYCGTNNTASSKFAKYDVTNEDEDKANALLDIDVVRFKYKAGFRNGYDDNGYHYGVIAENVYGDFPDVISNPENLPLDALIPTGEETSSIGVDYSKFVPHLIKLCQMQQAQIDALTARLDALEC